MTEMNRRDAIGALAIGGIGASAMGAGMVPRAAHSPADGHAEAYTLPDLPYDYDALEPHLDAETMRIHHSKHHAGYVRGLNNAVAKLAAARDEEDASLVQHWERQLSFHAGGHVNHALFWTGMAPAGNGGGGRPEGALADKIAADFGSYDKFAWQFRAAAASVEGSGWGWLVYEPVGARLLVLQMQNQQEMMFAGAVPLLGVDVWEHAYYLKYQNRRKDYIGAFMNVVNWPEIQRRFDAAIT